MDTRLLLNKQLLLAARQDGNVEELLTSNEYRDAADDFVFDINCTDFEGNTPLHLAVQNGSLDNVNLIIEADGCDVDPQNAKGDTPLHLAVRIQDQDVRRAIVSALVEAGAVDSTRLANKAGQTPNALARIYCPNDTAAVEWTTPPARQLADLLDARDIDDGSDDD